MASSPARSTTPVSSPGSSHVRGGKVAEISGGGEYGRRFEEIIDRFKDVQYPAYPGPGYGFVNDATIGANPKTFRAIETLWHTATPWYGGGNERYRAGVIHFGFGAEHDDPEFIKFGRENQVPIKHMAHVHAYFPTTRSRTAPATSGSR